MKGELSMVVAVADACVNRLGLGLRPLLESPDAAVSDAELCTPLLAEIGLETDGERVMAEFRIEFEAAKSLR